MASQLQDVINLGQQMNLSGDELMKFACEMVADMKAQRLEDRRLEAERREAEAKLEIQKGESEAKLEVEKRETREVEARLEIQKREFEAKLEVERLETREIEARLAHDQRIELEKLKLQQLQCENETRIRLDEIRVRGDIEVANNFQSRSSMESQSHSWSGKRFDLGLGQVDNVGENLDSFINRFELVAKAYNYPISYGQLNCLSR